MMYVAGRVDGAGAAEHPRPPRGAAGAGRGALLHGRLRARAGQLPQGGQPPQPAHQGAGGDHGEGGGDNKW